MKIKHLVILTSLLCSAQITAVSANDTSNLPAYGADLTQTSVSGLSSGAFMTSQIHVAYSNDFIGAGVIAGGPYYCSGSYSWQSHLQNAMTTCMSPLTASVAPDGKKLFDKAETFAANGFIDDLNNLKDDKVYLFSGQNDKTVKTLVVDQTKVFYEAADIAGEQIFYNDTVNAGHAIITSDDDDVACSETHAPYINDCDFIQSHNILKHIYGEDLRAPAETGKLSGQIIEFNQAEFIPPSGKHSSMSEKAYAYVPQSCETGACRVHVAFHGCEQGANFQVKYNEKYGDQYYTTTGYNELADTNNIIVLYPQAEGSNVTPFNPKGCWDFWGYSSNDFYKKTAPQMVAVMGMVERLGKQRQTVTAELTQAEK